MDDSIPTGTSADEFTARSPEVEVATPTASLDLDGIERDLADVEVALSRLDAGTYWTDEVTGAPLSAELLDQHPTARRA